MIGDPTSPRVCSTTMPNYVHFSKVVEEYVVSTCSRRVIFEKKKKRSRSPKPMAPNNRETMQQPTAQTAAPAFQLSLEPQATRTIVKRKFLTRIQPTPPPPRAPIFPCQALCSPFFFAHQRQHDPARFVMN